MVEIISFSESCEGLCDDGMHIKYLKCTNKCELFPYDPERLADHFGTAEAMNIKPQQKYLFLDGV